VHQTLHKAARVLNLFSVQQPEWGVGEVARTLELPKSTASEILSSLAGEGLLRRTGLGQYRLGWRLLELGQTLLHTTEFRAEARPVMQELVATWGETTHLAALEAGQVIYVEKLQGTQAIQIAQSGVGARLAAHCSGVGKVLLAHLPAAEVAAIVERYGLPMLTPNTITTLEQLEAELEQVRARGYAYDLEEVMLHLCCVAAPIRDFEGAVVAAMSLSVPAFRFQANKERYTAAIVGAAEQVSREMGYRKDTARWAPKR
jgi:IclR family transcriptional regulator, KDG regulon repressor